ncbi:MAG: class I SAM-dependent methyltransferase [Nitrospirae bacterium]|nr:class I SAM-dependent methyltransferase [Nitrospirota bacterium]
MHKTAGNQSDMAACPACGSQDSVIVYKKEEAYFANLDISINLVIEVCGKCGFVFQSSAYDKSYDGILSKCYNNYNKYLLFPFPNQSIENIKTLQMLLKHIPDEGDFNILEIGSNRGDMLYMIKKNRPNVTILGIEPAKMECHKTVPTIRSIFNIDIISNKFDLVIMQHVFEHVKYPRKFLEAIRHILSDKGMLYIEVPNIDNVLNYCLDDFVAEHVNYFNCNTLDTMLNTFIPIESDCESFVRTIYKIAPVGHESNTTYDSEIIHRFNKYKSNREEIINKICQWSKEDKTLVFYGVSFYYKMLLRELNQMINIGKCFFCDDNYMEDNEQEFGLRRLKEFNKDCIVIICSNNFMIQDSIYNKISDRNVFAIIKPWRLP